MSSSWVQPAASCSSQDSYSAFWIGIDGDGSDSVEQTGSEVDCSGGSPVPPSLLADVQALGVPMLQMFGLTESSAMATLLPAHDASRKLGSAGLPVPRTCIEIVGADDRPCPRGEVGEIVVFGPQVMRGYWRNPEATAAALRGGGLHTGDLGYLDDEGYLYVVDRAKDMLITGGLNVYPAEIERVLAGMPGIRELAVIGVPHDRWGEAPAVIACTDGRPLDPQAVRAAVDVGDRRDADVQAVIAAIGLVVAAVRVVAVLVVLPILRVGLVDRGLGALPHRSTVGDAVAVPEQAIDDRPDRPLVAVIARRIGLAVILRRRGCRWCSLPAARDSDTSEPRPTPWRCATP